MLDNRDIITISGRAERVDYLFSFEVIESWIKHVHHINPANNDGWTSAYGVPNALLFMHAN